MATGNCDDFVALIMDYIDGELSGRDRQRLMEHLRQCADCASQVQKLRLLRLQLRSLPPVAASPGFEAGLRARLRREQQARSRRLLRLAPFASWRVAGYAVAMLVFCLAALGALLLLRHGHQLAVTPKDEVETAQLGVADDGDTAAVVVNYVLDSVPIDAELLGRGVPLGSQALQGSALPMDSLAKVGATQPAVKPRLVSF
ncbi:MAG: zf-HC2 domain-containing protein [Candidatus Oleimicrobiaceae bacterium]